MADQQASVFHLNLIGNDGIAKMHNLVRAQKVVLKNVYMRFDTIANSVLTPIAYLEVP